MLEERYGKIGASAGTNTYITGDRGDGSGSSAWLFDGASSKAKLGDLDTDTGLNFGAGDVTGGTAVGGNRGSGNEECGFQTLIGYGADESTNFGSYISDFNYRFPMSDLSEEWTTTMQSYKWLLSSTSFDSYWSEGSGALSVDVPWEDLFATGSGRIGVWSHRLWNAASDFRWRDYTVELEMSNIQMKGGTALQSGDAFVFGLREANYSLGLSHFNGKYRLTIYGYTGSGALYTEDFVTTTTSMKWKIVKSGYDLNFYVDDVWKVTHDMTVSGIEVLGPELRLLSKIDNSYGRVPANELDYTVDFDSLVIS